MADEYPYVVVFNQRGDLDVELPEDVWQVVFAFLVDPQSISSIQQTCRTTRRWKYDTLHQWKLDWVYKNMEVFLGAEETKRLRDGSLTSIKLRYNNIGAEGGKAIGEGLKVNTSLTSIYLRYNNIGDEGGKAIGEGLKVNTSLTSIHLRNNTIGAEGRGALREAGEVSQCWMQY